MLTWRQFNNPEFQYSTEPIIQVELCPERYIHMLLKIMCSNEKHIMDIFEIRCNAANQLKWTVEYNIRTKRLFVQRETVYSAERITLNKSEVDFHRILRFLYRTDETDHFPGVTRELLPDRAEPLIIFDEEYYHTFEPLGSFRFQNNDPAEVENVALNMFKSFEAYAKLGIDVSYLPDQYSMKYFDNNAFLIQQAWTTQKIEESSQRRMIITMCQWCLYFRFNELNNTFSRTTNIENRIILCLKLFLETNSKYFITTYKYLKACHDNISNEPVVYTFVLQQMEIILKVVFVLLKDNDVSKYAPETINKLEDKLYQSITLPKIEKLSIRKTRSPTVYSICSIILSSLYRNPNAFKAFLVAQRTPMFDTDEFRKLMKGFVGMGYAWQTSFRKRVEDMPSNKIIPIAYKMLSPELLYQELKKNRDTIVVDRVIDRILRPDMLDYGFFIRFYYKYFDAMNVIYIITKELNKLFFRINLDIFHDGTHKSWYGDGQYSAIQDYLFNPNEINNEYIMDRTIISSSNIIDTLVNKFNTPFNTSIILPQDSRFVLQNNLVTVKMDWQTCVFLKSLVKNLHMEVAGIFKYDRNLNTRGFFIKVSRFITQADMVTGIFPIAFHTHPFRAHAPSVPSNGDISITLTNSIQIYNGESSLNFDSHIVVTPIGVYTIGLPFKCRLLYRKYQDLLSPYIINKIGNWLFEVVSNFSTTEPWAYNKQPHGNIESWNFEDWAKFMFISFQPWNIDDIYAPETILLKFNVPDESESHPMVPAPFSMMV